MDGWQEMPKRTTVGDLGDPTSTSAYALCLYAKAGGSTVAVVEEDVPAGKMCKGVPCWSAYGTGFRYRDSKTQHGSISRCRWFQGPPGKPVST